MPHEEAVLVQEERVAILSDSDVVRARQVGRTLAASIGFSATDQALIATAISELARNIVLYARSGEVRVDTLTNGGRRGLIVVARDDGPGIPDVERALEPGFSTSGGLGLGLPGVRRLMDEIKVESKRGRGTTVTARKWLR
ncbi:MAG TPA: anti-sigma regulatory factor [Candidatus Polarisedimenticolia bacterium]|nr:anti-sigma regulatory factor [Candidatus Polarisedimenticolia bacterium]